MCVKDMFQQQRGGGGEHSLKKVIKVWLSVIKKWDVIVVLRIVKNSSLSM